MSTRLRGPRRQKALLGWHRTLVWTGLSLVGLHVVALLLDPTLHFGVGAVLVPFLAPWHPGGRGGSRGRLAGADPGGLVQAPEVDRPTRLAPAPLREFRGVR